MKVVIVGAGSVGCALAELLVSGGDYAVLLADCTEEAIARAERLGFSAVHVDASRMPDLRALVAGHDIVVAAVPDQMTSNVAAAATAAGAHYLDFCNRTDDTQAHRPEEPAARAFLTGCGISPGLVDDVAANLAAGFPGEVDLAVRVGAIPARQTNRLGYGLIWNLEGLLAEYTSPCEAIVDGEHVLLPPLSRHETFALDGVSYEAFCTAGGIGNLIGLVDANVRNLVYRTIRYPGHLDYMNFLLDDLGLRHRRDLLKTVLRNGLPEIEDDLVLVCVTARGLRDGAPTEDNLVLRVKATATDNPSRANALALGSAAHAACLVDQLRGGTWNGDKPLDLPQLLANRFLSGAVTCERNPDFRRAG